jgi:predicted dehydrogenase
LLSVFHNRRWATDITTLRGVLDEGVSGDVWRFDSRFDLDQAQTLEAGPNGGLLRDLGSHLVDQALAARTGAAGIGEPGLGGPHLRFVARSDDITET